MAAAVVPGGGGSGPAIDACNAVLREHWGITAERLFAPGEVIGSPYARPGKLSNYLTLN